MRLNGLFIMVFMLIFTSVTHGAPVDLERAKRVARNFYFERSNGTPFQIATVTELGVPGQTLFYVFNSEQGGGFVMVSGDDGIYPVPGYSLTKNWQHDTLLMPPAFRTMLDHYKEQVLHHIDYSLPPTPEAVAAWAHYDVATHYFSAATLSAVSPLLGLLEWGQGCYYNDDCPYDPNAGMGYCNRVPVGCVATSMAMIMKYWEYPASGIGSNSYLHPDYGTLSANFGASSYNWSQMPPVVTTTNPEVAKVSYHAGVAVNMQYGPTGSGAYTSDARDAMVDNFGFQSIAAFLWRQNYTMTQWDSLLQSNLNLNRPLIYRGSNSAGADGHAWIIDGYQGVANNHYHCNWGWDGYLNGYFYLTSLTPGNTNFTYYQGAIADLVPIVTQPPTADFSANPTIGNIGMNISFTCQSSGVVSGWKWYFGDGDSSSVQHPVHVYSQPGIYTVTLIASNQTGSDTITKTNYIEITIPPIPVADFSASPLVAPVGSPVQFADLSHNTPLQWLWDFGDGQTSTSQHPQHIYQTIDTFTVTLWVSNGAGSDSITKTNYIVTTPPAAAANFSVQPSVGYPGDTLWFIDLSQHNPIEWLWDFGNGDTSHLQNPWYIYAEPGAYSISLTATNPYGYTELTKAFYVYIMPKPPMPKALFASDMTTILKGDSVLFTDYSVSQPKQWEWSFPGGVPSSSTQQNPGRITYPNHGVYDVQLIVWNVSGSDTLIKQGFITVGTIGVENLQDHQAARIYPVPANDYLFVEATQPVRSVALYDLTGRVVRLWQFDNTSEQQIRLSLSDVHPGNYRMLIDGKDQRPVFKPLIILR